MRRTLETSLCCWAIANGGGPADREADAPTHMSEGSSQPWGVGREFSGHLPYAQKPKGRKVSMTA